MEVSGEIYFDVGGLLKWESKHIENIIILSLGQII